MNQHLFKQSFITVLILFTRFAFSQSTTLNMQISQFRSQYSANFIESALQSFTFAENRLNDLNQCPYPIEIIKKNFLQKHLAKTLLFPAAAYSIVNFKLPELDGTYSRNKPLGYVAGSLMIGGGIYIDNNNRKLNEPIQVKIHQIYDYLRENIQYLSPLNDYESIAMLLSWLQEQSIMPEEFTAHLYALKCPDEKNNSVTKQSNAYFKHLKNINSED